MNISTINELISLGKQLKISSETMSIKEIVINTHDEKFIVNFTSIIDRYYDILLDHTSIVKLNDEEYLRYRYKPKLLSEELYGTQELHSLLLRLNHITSVIQFDFTELRVFNTNIIKLINEIMILEDENYITNEMEIIKEINE